VIELIELTENMVNEEYENEFGAGNFSNRDDYQFTIKIARDFPCFKITKAAPSWIIADIYEFIHDIFSNYDFDNAMANNAIELNNFLDYLEKLVKQEKSDVYLEIFDSWNYQTLKQKDLERLITFFKPKTLGKWKEYKISR